MALHEVSVLFRAQDHLSNVLGKFFSQFTALEGKTETFQQNLTKLGNLQERINQKQIENNARVVRDQEHFQKMQQRHADSIVQIQEDMLRKRERLHRDHNDKLVDLDERTHKAMQAVEKREYAKRDTLLSKFNAQQTEKHKALKDQLKAIQTVHDQRLSAEQKSFKQAQDNIQSFATQEKKLQITDLQNRAIERQIQLTERLNQTKSAYDERIKAENQSAKISRQNIQREITASQREEARLQKISVPATLPGVNPNVQAIYSELQSQYQDIWRQVDEQILMNPEMANELISEGKQNTSGLKTRIADIAKAAGIAQAQHVDLPATEARTAELQKELERVEQFHAASVQALEAGKSKDVTAIEKRLEQSQNYFENKQQVVTEAIDANTTQELEKNIQAHTQANRALEKANQNEKAQVQAHMDQLEARSKSVQRIVGQNANKTVATWQSSMLQQKDVQKDFLDKQLQDALKQLPIEERALIDSQTEANNRLEQSWRRVSDAARAAGENQLRVLAEEEATRKRLLPYQERYEAAQRKLGAGVALFGEGVGMTYLGSMARGFLHETLDPLYEAGKEKTAAELVLRSEINEKYQTETVQNILQGQLKANSMLTEPSLINTFIALRSALGGRTEDVFGNSYKTNPDVSILNRSAQFKAIMEHTYGMNEQQIDMMFKQVEQTTARRLDGQKLSEVERKTELFRRLNIINALEAYATKNRLSPSNISAFLARSAGAHLTFTDQGLLNATMLSLLLPAGSAGAAITALTQQIAQPGVHFHSTQAIAMLEKLGLINPKSIHYRMGKKGPTQTVEYVDPNMNPGYILSQQDPVAYAEQFVLPAFERVFPRQKGESLKAAQARWASMAAVAFPGTQSSRLISLLFSQGGQLRQEAMSVWHSAGVPQAAEELKNSPIGVMAQFHAQIKNLQMALSDGLIPVLTDWMKKLTPIVEKVSDWAKKNTKLVETLINVSLVVAGIITILGPLMMFAGVLKGLGALPKVIKTGGTLAAQVASGLVTGGAAAKAVGTAAIVDAGTMADVGLIAGTTSVDMGIGSLLVAAGTTFVGIITAVGTSLAAIPFAGVATGIAALALALSTNLLDIRGWGGALLRLVGESIETAGKGFVAAVLFVAGAVIRVVNWLHQHLPAVFPDQVGSSSFAKFLNGAADIEHDWGKVALEAAKDYFAGSFPAAPPAPAHPAVPLPPPKPAVEPPTGHGAGRAPAPAHGAAAAAMAVGHPVINLHGPVNIYNPKDGDHVVRTLVKHTGRARQSTTPNTKTHTPGSSYGTGRK